MPGEMIIRIWDVEHGACAILFPREYGVRGKLAMVDSGDSPDFTPSHHIRHELNRDVLDYLFVTNADQDHLSDLKGLENAGIQIGTLFRNPSPDADVLRGIKEQQGELTQDIERFLELHRTYIGAPTPFDQNMGGISIATFFNRYPRFTDTNNLSLAVFFRFGSFKILFPGDLEEQGWLALLEQPAFRQELADTTVLVAAHHGRESGYCEEIFQYFTPHAIVMSDKAIIHDTQQMARTYHAKTRARGVRVRTTGQERHVLTTRNDGHITFLVDDLGQYLIDTEHGR